MDSARGRFPNQRTKDPQELWGRILEICGLWESEVCKTRGRFSGPRTIDSEAPRGVGIHEETKHELQVVSSSGSVQAIQTRGENTFCKVAVRTAHASEAVRHCSGRVREAARIFEVDYRSQQASPPACQPAGCQPASQPASQSVSQPTQSLSGLRVPPGPLASQPMPRGPTTIEPGIQPVIQPYSRCIQPVEPVQFRKI